GYAEGLASALEKIAVHYQGAAQTNRVLAPMYIVNPMEALAAVGLFSTHPPTEERVQILRSMGGGVGYVDYDAAFRKLTGKGVIGERTKSQDKPEAAGGAAPGMPAVAAADTREQIVERSREVTKMMGRLDGMKMMRCECGVGIKVPPGSTWTTIPCPRCGRENPVPK